MICAFFKFKYKTVCKNLSASSKKQKKILTPEKNTPGGIFSVLKFSSESVFYPKKNSIASLYMVEMTWVCQSGKFWMVLRGSVFLTFLFCKVYFQKTAFLDFLEF